MRILNGLAPVLALTLGLAAPAAAQQEEAELPPPLEVGAVAPDFALPAATRAGVLEEPVRLGDFTGEVVVLSFFVKARTRG